MIRVFAGNVPKGDSEDTAVAHTIEGFKTVLPYAVEKGVTLALKNHGGITATPGQILKLVKGIDSPNFGVNLDTGNFRGEDPYAELAELAPYAVNVQVRPRSAARARRRKTPTLPVRSRSSARQSTPATSFWNTRPRRTRWSPCPRISRRCGI